jgi:hypothetical protein
VIFINSTTRVRLQLLNHWLLKVKLRCVNDGVTTIKTWTSDKWKRARDMVRWVVLHAVPYIRKTLLTFGEHQRKYTIRNAWFQQWNMGRFCDGLGTYIIAHYSVGPIITLHGWIPAREYVDRLGNRVNASYDPGVITEKWCSFPRHSWNC